MTISSRKTAILVLATAVAQGPVFSEKDWSEGGPVSSAEARVGRPLTPMSYAGVARRTTRRAVAVGAAGHAPLTARIHPVRRLSTLTARSPHSATDDQRQAPTIPSRCRRLLPLWSIAPARMWDMVTLRLNYKFGGPVVARY